MQQNCHECWKQDRRATPADTVYKGDPLCAYHLKKAKEDDQEPPAVAESAKDALGFRQKQCHNPRCKKDFTPTGPRALYCSPECREDMTSKPASPTSSFAPTSEAKKQEVTTPTSPKTTAHISSHVPRGSNSVAVADDGSVMASFADGTKLNGPRKLDGFEVRTFRADEYRLPIGTKECAFPKLCEYLRGQASGTVTTVNAADPTPRGIKLLRDKLKRVMKNEKISAKVIQNQKEQHVAIIRN